MSPISNLNPWLSMWSRPRETVRAIVFSRPSYGVYTLSILYALQCFFFYANWWSLGIRTHYSLYLGLGIVASPLLGICWIYLMGLFFSLFGKCFRGKASQESLRVLIAWSSIPYTITLCMWLSLFFFSPENAFIQDSSIHSSVFTNGITLIAKVWSFILLVQSLKEIQHFSLWIAILNVVLVGLFSSILFFFTFSVLRIFVF